MSASVADAGATLSLARDDERLLTGVDDGTTTDGYGYDDNDRLTSALGRTYTYDDGDDLTQTATAAGAPVTLAYDDAGQLTTSSSAGITASTFTYNNNGQRTAMTPRVRPGDDLRLDALRPAGVVLGRRRFGRTRLMAGTNGLMSMGTSSRSPPTTAMATAYISTT